MRSGDTIKVGAHARPPYMAAAEESLLAANLVWRDGDALNLRALGTALRERGGIARPRCRNGFTRTLRRISTRRGLAAIPARASWQGCCL